MVRSKCHRRKSFKGTTKPEFRPSLAPEPIPLLSIYTRKEISFS